MSSEEEDFILNLPDLPQRGIFNEIPRELAIELQQEVARYPAPEGSSSAGHVEHQDTEVF